MKCFFKKLSFVMALAMVVSLAAPAAKTVAFAASDFYAADQVTGEEVTSVTLELGEVSGVIGEYLSDCWKWAIKKEELLKESKLLIETIPAVTYCEDCKNTYETIAHGKICPDCGSPHTYLIQGNEFNIKEIEAI